MIPRGLVIAVVASALWASGAAAAGGAAPPDTVRVLVVYHSETGNTEAMARGVVEGAESVPGTVVRLRSVAEVDRDDLVEADAIALGSPTYFGNMSGTMKRFIDDWWLRYEIFLGDRVGGAFATGGGMAGGKEHVVSSLVRSMLGNGMIVVGPVFEVGGARFGNPGPAAATMPPYEGVGPDELAGARSLGRRLAEVAGRLAPAPQAP